MTAWQETEYGRAPSDWKIMSIGDLSEKVTDGAHFSPRPQASGKYMCSVKDMTYDRFNFTDCKLISSEDFDRLVTQGCQPKKGDILISKDGANCLDLIFVFNQEEELALLSSIAIVRLLPTSDPFYVRYFLLSPSCQDTMRNNFVSGSAIPRVVLKDFKKVPILLPSLPEQKAIAAMLSSLDDKIDLLHRQNQTLEAMAATLFRQWFVEEAQEDWTEYSVSDFAGHIKDNVVPANLKNELFHHYSLPAFDDGKRPTIEMGSAILSNKYQVVSHSILVSKLNPRVPRIWPIGNLLNENAICSTEFQVFKPKNEKLYGYLYFLLCSNDAVDALTMAASGTSGSHQRVRPEDILNIRTSLPLLDRAEQYSILVMPCINKVRSNLVQIQTLEKLRDNLLPKLMSGEVRVAA